LNLVGSISKWGWERLNLEYVSLAIGLIVAASIAIGFGALRNDASLHSLPSRHPDILESPGSMPLVPQTETIEYVVSSQEQANELSRVLGQAAPEDSRGNLREVMVVDSPQTEGSLEAAEDVLLGAGITSVLIVDLR
jgi:hypothetical protein